MGEQGIKRLIIVFAEAMSRVASRQSRVPQAIGDDTKADGANKSHLRNQVRAIKKDIATKSLDFQGFFVYLPFTRIVMRKRY